MRVIRVTMPDLTLWDIPVDVIARNRAAAYAEEFNNDIELSLKEDTLPLFESNEYEIKDWAANNMNWDDVKEVAKFVSNKIMTDGDFQEGWVNGNKEILEVNY